MNEEKPIRYTLTVWKHNNTGGHDYHDLSIEDALYLIRELTIGTLSISHPSNRVELKPMEAV
jgi:hypothetical protein